MSKKANKTVPKLRFPEFEGDWKISTIEEIASVSSGGTPSRTESTYWNGDIPWVTTSEISQAEIFDSVEKITQKGLENSSAKLFKKNTILIAMYGQGKTRGQVSILRIEATTNQACAAITLLDAYSPEFIYYFLSKEYENLRLLSNDGSQKNLSAGLIKQYKVSLTSLAEQEKIASFLRAVDTRLTQLRRKHELLQTYKRGVMQKLFSQEIRFKRDDGKSFPDWYEKCLDELGEFKNGFNADKSAFGDGVEFINLMDIFGKSEIKKTSLDRVQISQQQLKQYKVQKGDTLFVRSSVKREGVGQSCLVNDDFEDTVYSGFIIRFRDKSSELIHLYKKYCFASLEFRQNLLSLATSSANTNINQESLSAIHLTYPCKEEQGKIVKFLTAIDEKIEAVAKAVDLTEQFKKGLLHKMFV
jgi:type I restriction enzyme S subunit